MYKKEEHHYRCEECNTYFSEAPHGTCSSGHTNIIAIGWLLVLESIKEAWFRKIRRKEE